MDDANLFVRRIVRGDVEIVDASPTELAIVRELGSASLGALDWGAPLDPAVAARIYRGLRAATGNDPEGIAYVEATRAMLHREAEAGNEIASAALELLADDPWWSRHDLDCDRSES